jgi:hypothetical protein
MQSENMTPVVTCCYALNQDNFRPTEKARVAENIKARPDCGGSRNCRTRQPSSHIIYDSYTRQQHHAICDASTNHKSKVNSAPWIIVGLKHSCSIRWDTLVAYLFNLKAARRKQTAVLLYN